MTSTWRIVSVVAMVGTGCIGDPGGGEEVGTAEAALTPITWTNVVGASAVGNSLTKTAGATLWNAGASSVETLTADGYVEFTTGENTTAKMAGLGSGDASQHFSDIEFAIRLGESGGVAAFESGSEVFMGGGYQAGDVFRVQVLGGVVSYWQNGAVFYTSAAPAPAFPLVVDTSLRTPGATVNEVAIESLVFWKGVKRALAVGNDLLKTDPSDAWNAGAVSVAKLEGDGFAQFNAGENDTDRMAGLSHGNSGTGYADIDFAISLRSNGRFQVYEAGVNRGGFGKYAPGDVFRVQVVNGEVTYWKNGIPFYTSLVAPTFPLLFDTALRTPGATILDAQLGAGAPEDPVCLAHQQMLTGEDLPPGPPIQDMQEFGVSLAAAGDVLAIGTPYSTPPFAVVYRDVAGSWQPEQVLTRSDGLGTDMADALATDGQTIAIGSWRDDSFGFLSGSALIYRYDGANWESEGLFGGCPGDQNFGRSVDVRGDLMVSGMANNTAPAPAGRAYVYRRGAGGWSLEAILTPPDGVANDRFGYSVAIGGDRIFVGANGKDTNVLDGGGLYVYRYHPEAAAGSPTCGNLDAGRWQVEDIVYPANAQELDWFARRGLEANASGTQVVVGNPQFGGDDDGEPTPNGPGTAHLFSFDGAGWSETQVFVPSQPDSSDGDEFGDFLAFGGPDPDAPSLLLMSSTFGANTYAYQRLGGWWVETDYLTDPDGAEFTGFGRAVAASGSWAFIASPAWDGDGGGAANLGAVHAYDVLECPAP